MDEIVRSLSSRITVDNISKIGQGSFGEVYLVKDRTKEQRVVKRVDLHKCKPKDKASAVEEALILSRLSHPNVLSIIDFFAEDTYLYVSKMPKLIFLQSSSLPQNSVLLDLP